MSSGIRPATRLTVANKRKQKALRKSFREVFYKYVRPGIGTDWSWTMRFGKDRRKNVISRLKLLLSWVSQDDVFILTDQEIFTRLIDHYMRLVNYYRGSDYHEFIMWKYGEIYL